MHENLVPDVSLGTHFLNELVETDMLYLALFPDRGSNYLRIDLFENSPNRLLQLVLKAGKWVDAVKVVDACEIPLWRHLPQCGCLQTEGRLLLRGGLETTRGSDKVSRGGRNENRRQRSKFLPHKTRLPCRLHNEVNPRFYRWLSADALPVADPLLAVFATTERRDEQLGPLDDRLGGIGLQ